MHIQILNNVIILLNFLFSYYGIYSSELNSIFKAKHISELQQSVFPVNKNVQSDKIFIVKRSIATDSGLELTKIFTNVVGDVNNFYCSITVKTLPNPIFLNETINVNEDLTQLTVSTINYQFLTGAVSTVNPTPNSIVTIPYLNVDNQQLSVQYYFRTEKIEKLFSKSVSILNPQMTTFLSTSGCINPASFEENVATYPQSKLFILLGIFIGLLILVILFLVDKFRNQSKGNVVQIYNETSKIETRFLALDDSKIEMDNYSCLNGEKYFLNTVIQKDPRIIELELYQIYIRNAILYDYIMKSDFMKLNIIIFQIWINNINSQLPSLKSKTDILRNMVNGLEEEIIKKYQRINDENKKKLIKESISINKMNLDYIRIKQEKERHNTLQLISDNDKVQVEDTLNKIFKQELYDLIVQLKIQEDLSIERDKQIQNQNMLTELNDVYVSSVREMISNNLLDEINSPKELNDIFKTYFDLVQYAQLKKETERIRQMTRLEYMFQVRKEIVKEKENEFRDLFELIEKKSESFIEFITILNDEEEIRYTTGISILNDFNKYKESLVNEMEKLKEKEINQLLITSNEKRKSKISELMSQHGDRVNSLLNDFKTGDHSNLVQDKLADLTKEYNENIKKEELFFDTEGVKEILQILRKIGSDTIDKLDSKIVKLTNEMESEGIDVEYILKDFQIKSKKLMHVLNSEKETHSITMKEDLKRSKEKIDRNEEIQINELNKRFGCENNIFDELINIQKTLSNDERYRIINDFNKTKICLGNSIATCYLEERQKLEEAIAFNKAKKIKDIEEKHEESVKVLFSKKLKNRHSNSEENIKEECLKSLIPEFLNNKLKLFIPGEWRTDTEKEIQAIHNRILSGRAMLLHNKEVQSVASVVKLQLLKAQEILELKEEEEKVKNTQLATLNLNNHISDDVFKTYNKSKDALEEDFLKTKLLQERNFKKKLENHNRKSLLSTVNERRASQKEDSLLKQWEQNFADQLLKTEIQKQRAFYNKEKDLLIQFITQANVSCDNILSWMLEVYPVKSKKEIEELKKEYVITPKQQNQIVDNGNISLLEEYSNYAEHREEKHEESLNDVRKISKKIDSLEPLTIVSNEYFVKSNDQEINNQIKSSKRRKKVRQKKVIDDIDESNDDF